MLNQYHLRQTNRSIEVFKHWQDEGWLELNAPYQRGDVWGIKRRQNLIKSILIGVPIPSIVVNDRSSSEGVWSEGLSEASWKFAVIDGKQRITTILRFLRSELSVPADWFHPHLIMNVCEEGLLFFHDLQIHGQRKFSNKSIAVSEGRLDTIEAEKEVFDLINFGGLAQGEVDTE